MKTFCETEVLSCDAVAHTDRRIHLNIKVTGLPARLNPGETVLFWEDDKTTPKCRTAAVAAPSPETTTLVAAFDEGDRLPAAGERMTIWSHLDEAVKVSAQSLIVTTRPFLYRIEPYAALGAEIMLDTGDAALWHTLRSRFGDGDWSACFLALSPGRLKAFAREFPGADPHIFINLAMSCGIGACRSCHVNLIDNRQGVATCIAGPWFALRRVDLDALQLSSLPFK